MRGKQGSIQLAGAAQRNIPAYAGKTLTQQSADATGAEHPRVCGENIVTQPKAWLGEGTSPRMRGKPHATRPGAQTIRNIPAYAGKTRLREIAYG